MSNGKCDPQGGPDDLLWLEPPYDEKALAWARDRTRRSMERLRALPSFAEVQRELAETLKSVTTEPIIKLTGPRALRFLVSEAHPYGELQVADRAADGMPGAWRTVLDVDALRKRSGVPYVLDSWALEKSCAPPDYSRYLLRLSPGGGDQVETLEFDLDRGEFVEDGFNVPRSVTIAQRLQRDLLLVGHTLSGPRTLAGSPAAFRLWRRGQPLEAAPVVYEAEPTDVFVWPHAAGAGAARYVVMSRTLDYSNFEFQLIYQDGSTERVPVPSDAVRGSGMRPAMAAGPSTVFIQLKRETVLAGNKYPANALIAYSVDRATPADQRFKLVYTPAADEFVYGPPMLTTRDCLFFVVNRHLEQKGLLAEPDDGAWSVRELLRLEPGEVISEVASEHRSNDLIVTSCGFLTPTRQVLYRSGVEPRLLAQDPVRFEGAEKYTTEIRSAISKDGTPVDYYLLRPRVPQRSELQPLLVTGYAAFGSSLMPAYFGSYFGGPAFKLWLERGGSLALPAARGGEERGQDWHRAAMGKHRQRSYDDFIAVLDQLVNEGFTAPGRIGVFGASNGGLLAAVLATQRPHLFGAALSDVPITDMLRMKFMGKGSAWLGEYGDPADSGMAPVLASYSPLHNVRPGVNYPPLFISISTEDDRVGPGHARKLAARFDQVGAPVYFYENTEGGHGVSNVYHTPELMALRMTFLIHHLMAPQP